MNLFLSIPLLMWFDAPDLAKAGERLILLHPVDMAIIAIYFADGAGDWLLPETLHQEWRGLLSGRAAK